MSNLRTNPELDSRPPAFNRLEESSSVARSRAIEKVVAFLPLSRNVPTRLIVASLAQRLQVETEQSVLVLHLIPETEDNTAADPCRNPGHQNGEIPLEGMGPAADQRLGELRLGISPGSWEPRRLEEVLERALARYERVLLVISQDLPVPWVAESLLHAQRSYLLVSPRVDDFYHRDLLLREIEQNQRLVRHCLKTIVCREKGDDSRSEWFRLKSPGSVDGLIQGCPPATISTEIECWNDNRFREDIRRLAREIGRCRVGLALSSGGARGLAHIGIIQVLEENEIEIDVVAGCSMGAYVGAVWASGYDGVYMEKLAREVEHKWGLLELLDPFLFPRQGFLRGYKVKERLKRAIGEVHFCELVRPLRVVATNLTTLERTVFAEGEVAEAVHASLSIPGACAPVRVRGELHIDGGICDPLPVDLLQEIGVERIIAVNTIPTPAYLRLSNELRSETAAWKHKRRGPIRSFLNRHLNYFAGGNILDTIFRSFHGAQIRVAEQACREASLVLRPISLDGRWHDFTHPGKYIAIGRQEAEKHLENIKALLHKKRPSHEIAPSELTVATPA